MPHHVTSVNYALDQLAASVTAISLHTATPSSAGSNEVSGGGYSRFSSPVFNAASAGVAALSTSPNFNVTSVTIHSVGYWRGTQFAGYGALTSPRVITGADVFQLQAFRLRLDGVTLLT